MPSFASMEALLSSLPPGLAAHAPAIAATARAGVLLPMLQVEDAALAVGASKVGGDPDLPPDFAWPWRPAYPDAQKRIDAQDRVLRRLEGRIAIDWAVERAKQAPLTRAFPLAFVAQIDLGALPPGMDPLIPGTGLLSVFHDVADGFTGSPRVFHHDLDAGGLARRPSPAEILDHHDAFVAKGDHIPPWAACDRAERLRPVPAVDLPEGWHAAFPEGSAEGAAMSAWLDNAKEGPLIARDPGELWSGNKLGGWPDSIQGSPEEEVDGVAIDRPGATPWRHLLSLSVGELYAGTRLMPLDCSSDGNTYLFIKDEDLRARRFDRVEAVHQMT